MAFKFNPCRVGQHCCGVLDDAQCLYADHCFNCNLIPFVWYMIFNGMSNECSADMNINSQLTAQYQGDGLCLWQNTYGSTSPINWLVTPTVGSQGDFLYVSITVVTSICSRQAIYSIHKNNLNCTNNNTLNYETPGVNFIYTYPEFDTHGATLLLAPADKADLPSGRCPCSYYSDCFSVPIYYGFTLSNISFYHCNGSTSANKDWIITTTGNCTWEASLFNDITTCYYASSIAHCVATLYFDFATQNYYLNLFLQACPSCLFNGAPEGGTLVYKLSKDLWSCLGPNTLLFYSITNNTLGVPFLTSYPDSITVTPV